MPASGSRASCRTSLDSGMSLRPSPPTASACSQLLSRMSPCCAHRTTAGCRCGSTAVPCARLRSRQAQASPSRARRTRHPALRRSQLQGGRRRTQPTGLHGVPRATLHGCRRTADSARERIAVAHRANARPRPAYGRRNCRDPLGVSHGTVRNWGALGLLAREVVAKGPQRTHALYALPNADTVAEILRHKGKWRVCHPLIAGNEEVCHTE